MTEELKPSVAEALKKLQDAAGAVATWINHWDLPFADEDEWRGDKKLFFDAINGAAEALTAAEAAALSSEWRDISTAPRDGTEVDLWCRNISADSTDEARFPAMTSEGDPWEDWHGYLLEPKWLPTHWKPAPAPPQRNEVTK